MEKIKVLKKSSMTIKVSTRWENGKQYIDNPEIYNDLIDLIPIVLKYNEKDGSEYYEQCADNFKFIKGVKSIALTLKHAPACDRDTPVPTTNKFAMGVTDLQPIVKHITKHAEKFFTTDREQLKAPKYLVIGQIALNYVAADTKEKLFFRNIIFKIKNVSDSPGLKYDFFDVLVQDRTNKIEIGLVLWVEKQNVVCKS